MKELVKRAFMLGLGAAVITRKKAEKVIMPWVRKGMMNASEAGKLANEMLREADEYRKSLEKMSEAEARKSLKGVISASSKHAKKIGRHAKSLAEKMKSHAKNAAIKAIRGL